MSSWFKNRKSIPECNTCARSCHNPLQIVHSEIQSRVDVERESFENCLGAFAKTLGETYRDSLRLCVNNFTELTVIKYKEIKSFAEEILKSYSSR